MKMSSRGVVPLVAEVILLVITLTVASLLIIVLAGLPATPPPPRVTFGIDGFEAGSDRLTIHHIEGEMIVDAFTLRDGKIEWVNLEAMLTAVPIETAPGRRATFNGETSGENIDFAAGDTLIIPLKDKIGAGAALVILHVPSRTPLYIELL